MLLEFVADGSGAQNHQSTIIGLSIGVSVAVLIIAVLVLLLKKKLTKRMPNDAPIEVGVDNAPNGNFYVISDDAKEN